MSVEPRYLRLTEETNALDCLERACIWLQEVEQDVMLWKWVILALYGAVYGFAVSACRGTNPENVREKPQGKEPQYSEDEASILAQVSLDPEVRRAASEELEKYKKRRKKEDDERLLSFQKVIELSQNAAYVSNPLQLTDQEKRSLDSLHKLRNKLVHYFPKLWSLELHYLPLMAKNVLRVIRFLALESNIYTCLEEGERAKVEKLIAQALAAIEKSHLYVETTLILEEGKPSARKVPDAGRD